MRTRWIAAGALVLAKARGLTPDQVRAAVQTFVPPGMHDDYLIFSSGGHPGR